MRRLPLEVIERLRALRPTADTPKDHVGFVATAAGVYFLIMAAIEVWRFLSADIVRPLWRFVQPWLWALALVALLAEPGVAEPPSCAPFSDGGCLFGENFEGGAWPPSGWSASGGAAATGSSVTPGSNGTSRRVRQLVPDTDGSSWITAGMDFTTTSGQTFWVEWWEEFDSAFRWGPGCASQLGTYPDCDNGLNWEHKHFDIRNSGPGGRIYFAPNGIESNTATATPRIYVNSDPEPVPWTPNHFVFDDGPLLTPGTYHFILQITSGYKADANDTTVGAFKMWVNGTLIKDHSNVGTCGNSNGTCTWNQILLGGQGAGVGSGGNIFYHDQVRITTTDLTPSGGSPRGFILRLAIPLMIALGVAAVGAQVRV